MMNSKLIPVLLIAVIMVAGAFAFAPIDQVSTVHETVSDNLDDLGQLLCDEVYFEDYDAGNQVCIDAEG